MAEKMMVGKLKKMLEDIPDDVAINVLNADGKWTSNMDFWFEDLETRQYIQLQGSTPFYDMDNATVLGEMDEDTFCWSCGKEKTVCKCQK